jgi:hypothetical protein
MRWLSAGLVFLTATALAADRAAPDPAAVQADAQALRQAGLPGDGPALLKFFRQRTPTEAEQGLLAHHVQQLGAAAYRAREQAVARLLKAGQRARVVLRDALHHPDPEVARRASLCLRRIANAADAALAPPAARLLAREQPPETAEVLLAYLPYADKTAAEAVRQTLTTVAVRDGRPAPALVQALGDPFPVKRAAAAEALARAGASGTTPAVRRLLTDPQTGVRLQVALALVEARDREGLPVLIDLLDKVPADQQWQIKDILQQVAGELAPDPPPGAVTPADEQARWAAWWQKHADRIDLATLHDPARLLGFTLVTQMDNRNPMGRVLEIDSARKMRWEITGLRYPVDAQVVGKDRVLIAEYLNRRVTERDFRGKILWEVALDMPNNCQRLLNGNTFIAGRRQLLEVDRNGKEVFSYFPPLTTVSAARKTRDGQIVLVTSGGLCQRLDPAGKELKRFTAGAVYTMGGNIDVLPGARTLIPQYRDNKVVEYDRDGKVVWEARFPMPTCAVRLPNGHTLVASALQQRIVELNREGREVWEFSTDGGRPWCARRR